VKRKRSLGKSIALGLAILLGLVVYAYGFSVTKVNFEETRSEVRLTQLTRILRALARPNILEYEQKELDVEAPIYLPCPAGGAPAQDVDTSGPYLILDPPCGEAKTIVEIEGHNLWPNAKGPLNFIPPSGAKLQVGNVETDSNGSFSAKLELPRRQPVEEAQIIRATVRQDVGPPHLSDVAHVTWQKIIETVFLALLATTIGTALAIPVSFLAARNLMSSVRNPVTNVALTVLGWLVGIAVSVPIAGWVNQVGESVHTSSPPLVSLAGMVVGPVVAWGLARSAMPQHEIGRPSPAQRVGRTVALIVAAGCGILALRLLANVAITAGNSLSDYLSSLEFMGIASLAFLGGFVAQLGDVLRMITPVLIAFIGGGALSGAGATAGELVSNRLPAVR
jgi:ABC-type phosphate/phosphonate transport system permease subunit